MAQGIKGLQYSPEQNSWFVLSGCLNIDSLPTVVLHLGTTTATLAPRQYITQVQLQPAGSPCSLPCSSTRTRHP